jgi:hypothetical protein
MRSSRAGRSATVAELDRLTSDLNQELPEPMQLNLAELRTGAPPANAERFVPQLPRAVDSVGRCAR